jgi:hypothetical protein
LKQRKTKLLLALKARETQPMVSNTADIIKTQVDSRMNSFLIHGKNIKILSKSDFLPKESGRLTPKFIEKLQMEKKSKQMTPNSGINRFGHFVGKNIESLV